MSRRGTLKAVAYLRVSTDKQDAKGLSLPAQADLIRDYAREQGIEIVEVYREARSARKDGRPQFARMLRALRDGQANALLIEKEDRLARNYADRAEYLGLVTDCGIEIHGVRDRKVLTNKTPPNDWFVHDIDAALANYHGRNLSLEVKKGMRQRPLQGRFANGRTPLGYLLDRKGGDLVIAEDESPLVVTIFMLYAEGCWSLQDIADYLNARGHRTRRGRRFGKVGVQQILGNRTYTGRYVRSKNEWFAAVHPAIIEAPLWERVREVERRRSTLGGGYAPRHPRSKEERPYTGLLSCAACGGPISYSRKRHPKTDEIQYRYWVCRGGKQCPGRRYVVEEEIDAAVEEALDQIRLPDRLVEAAIAAATSGRHEHEQEIEQLERQLAANQAGQRKIVDELLAGILMRDALIARQELLVEEADRIEAELARLHATAGRLDDAQGAVTRAVGLLRDLPRLWREGEMADRRALLQTLVHSAGARSAWDARVRVFIPRWREPWATLVPSPSASPKIRNIVAACLAWADAEEARL